MSQMSQILLSILDFMYLRLVIGNEEKFVSRVARSCVWLNVCWEKLGYYFALQTFFACALTFTRLV